MTIFSYAFPGALLFGNILPYSLGALETSQEKWTLKKKHKWNKEKENIYTHLLAPFIGKIFTKHWALSITHKALKVCIEGTFLCVHIPHLFSPPPCKPCDLCMFRFRVQGSQGVRGDILKMQGWTSDYLVLGLDYFGNAHVWKQNKQGMCQTMALPFALKSILRQKKNYENSNISAYKNIIFKKIL